MNFNILLPQNSIRRKIAKNIYNFIKGTKKYDDYKLWIKNNEPSKRQIDKQRKTNFKIMPKISIIVPIYNTPEEYFKDLIECMKNQTYSNWELCLGDGSPEKLDFIDKYISNDDRIKYKKISENKGIAGNTNEALSLSTGDYIGLLDHDDMLPIFSLFEVVKAINNNPDVEFLYSDEDKFEKVGGERYGAFFKPDFSLYTLRSANYICHFSVFKKNLMDKLGGFKSEYDGSQDYDIVLRASEKTDKIVHISKILYHWRVHKNSTSNGDNAKPYAYEIAKNVIFDHLKRSNINVNVVDGDTLGSYKLKYNVSGNPIMSIIIYGYDLENDEIDKMINNINEMSYKNIEIVVASNKYTNKFKEVKVFSEKLENFATECNKIVNTVIKGQYFMIIDNYTSFDELDSIDDLIGICEIKDVAEVGTKQYNEDNLVEHCGVVVGMNGIGDYVNKGIIKDYDVYMARLKIIHNVSAVISTLSIIKTEVFKDVNGFNNNLNSKLAMSIDLSLKFISRGLNVVINPMIKAKIENKKIDIVTENDKQFLMTKWGDYYKNCDGLYSKNLRYDNTNICINIGKVDL